MELQLSKVIARDLKIFSLAKKINTISNDIELGTSFFYTKV